MGFVPAPAGLGFLRESAVDHAANFWPKVAAYLCCEALWGSIEEKGNKMLPELKFPPVRI